MTATAQMTAPEFTAAVAALCGENEAAVVFITKAEGLSYCVADEAMAHMTAQGSAADPVLDDGDVLLAVGVIGTGGIVTEYYPVRHRRAEAMPDLPNRADLWLALFRQHHDAGVPLAEASRLADEALGFGSTTQ